MKPRIRKLKCRRVAPGVGNDDVSEKIFAPVTLQIVNFSSQNFFTETKGQMKTCRKRCLNFAPVTSVNCKKK